MTECYFVDSTDLTLAVVLERLKREEAEKKRRWRRLAVAGLVALGHSLIIGWMIYAKLSQLPPSKPPPETELLWLLKPPVVVKPGPNSTDQREEMIRQAYKAVQLLPPVDRDRTNAITVDDDVSMALGRSLACGAGSFEYLTPEGQRRCLRKPWGFTYDRYGYVILDTGRLPAREKPRPSDVLARQRNTAPECPNNVDPNAPCLGRIIRGN